MSQDKLSRANVLLAAAFGTLAAVVGVTVSRHPSAILLLTGAAVGLYVLAEARGWLVPSPNPPLSRAFAVTSAFAVLVTLCVGLTGGLTSPLLYALYLPVLLAGLCYAPKPCFVASIVMAGVWATFAATSSPLSPSLLVRDAAVALSFPLAATFACLLARQVAERYRVLDTRAEDMKSRADDLRALVDMSQMMDAANDLDTTLSLVLFNVEKVTGCAVCAVYLGGEGERLELRAATGPRERTATLRAALISEGGWTPQAAADAGGAALYVADAEEREFGVLGIPTRGGSFACVPLSTFESFLGMLYVAWDEPHGLPEAADVGRLEKLAERAAFSLGRAVMQHDFRSLAFSDPMTGLDNFRQFEQTLDAELLRAERYGRELSLILLDIDHFKKFNDTLGHQAGDALLSQLGGVLRDCLRSVDRPARYGGEEFVVLCPETGPDEARLIAERVRASVEKTLFTLPGTDGRRVTVSVGYATFPAEAGTPSDLIRAADMALYAAKHAGRNTVRGPENMALPALSA